MTSTATHAQIPDGTSQSFGEKVSSSIAVNWLATHSRGAECSEQSVYINWDVFKPLVLGGYVADFGTPHAAVGDSERVLVSETWNPDKFIISDELTPSGDFDRVYETVPGRTLFMQGPITCYAAHLGTLSDVNEKFEVFQLSKKVGGRASIYLLNGESTNAEGRIIQTTQLLDRKELLSFLSARPRMMLKTEFPEL